MSDLRPDEAAIRLLYEEGQRMFPRIKLSPEAFASHVAERFPAGEPPGAVHAADLYLACACATRVRGAIEAFERAHMSRVDRYLARLRPSAAFVDEVRQALREKLFLGNDGRAPRIAEYTGQGALSSWLRVVALRCAIDLQRRGRGHTHDKQAAAADQPATDDPELGYVQQRYRRAFNDALRSALGALAPEQRELLRLHFVDGHTWDQLAAAFGVHRATIARRLAAAREAIADETRRALGAALGASEAEIESLAGVMKSQIDTSLPGLLR